MHSTVTFVEQVADASFEFLRRFLNLINLLETLRAIASLQAKHGLL